MDYTSGRLLLVRRALLSVRLFIKDRPYPGVCYSRGHPYTSGGRSPPALAWAVPQDMLPESPNPCQLLLVATYIYSCSPIDTLSYSNSDRSYSPL